MGIKRSTFDADQRGALLALRAVAEALNLPPGEAPTAEQFKELAPTVAPGWSVHYVSVAYGRWREATRAFKEGRSPERRLHYGRLPRSDDPNAKALGALRLWLASSPSRQVVAAYKAFAESHNKTLGPDDEPLPMPSTIYNALSLNFDEAVRVAAGEVDLESARPHQRRKPPNLYDDREGPYGLIGPNVVADICGVPRHRLNAMSRLHNFPVASLVLGNVHLARRSDVEAFARGEEVPARPFNELREEYVTVSELAAELGIQARTVREAKWLPEPEVVASGFRGYRRSEVREALQRRGSTKG